MRARFNYWRRIFRSYFFPKTSALNFWHERPTASADFKIGELGSYYMTFEDKAGYAGPRDADGIILLDYHGDIGQRHNPIAIAQYGLARLNRYLKSRQLEDLAEAKKHGDWLVSNLKKNSEGVEVWVHDFAWRYRENLPPGWYSALAQGSGISLLARLFEATKEVKYLETAKRAFSALKTPIKQGGVLYEDIEGNIWLEEYIVEPPTHILNGFLWTLWGVWDYWLLTKEESAYSLFKKCAKTLAVNLPRYDIGFWSLYDLSEQAMKMIASPFYHRLHIVQLGITARLTNELVFSEYAERWAGYEKNPVYRIISIVYKAVFKIFYF